MANWQHTLPLKDLWVKYEEEDNPDIPPNEATENGRIVASRLRKLSEELSPLPGKLAKNLALDFEAVEDIDDFNEAMDSLWDFGDRYLIWVETLF